MKLNKYTWNNGTQSSPIILTNDQIKKLIAIGQREDIESNVSGYITTSSRKIHKFLKYALESQFKDLNVICNEELADTFSISLATNTIKEGTREQISIDTESGINHSFLKWKYDYSDFVIDGDLSEQNIKDRIRVENGYLIVDEPRENASWSVQLTLTAYPSYYSEEEFNNIPTSSKSDIILNIVSKKIENISIFTKPDVLVNSEVEFSVSPVPTDSTKLKGATYSYSTTTPDIININTSSQSTTITAKKLGTANLTVTIHACNNTITKSNSVTINVRNLRQVVFIIDQRFINSLVDPDDMVSANCILNSDGTLTKISSSGSVGDPNNNALSWIRKNTHAYVSRNLGFAGVRLKQLSDSNRKMFADGTSAADYISNENGEFDVFLKFGSDIYYKTEAWIPKGQTEPDPDYVAVTIGTEISPTDDASKWCKWSQYKLIGVYPSCQINNKLYSLSGKRPLSKISHDDSIKRAKARGEYFSICNYAMTKLFAFLFYGYYSSLGSQQICGYGTRNYTNNTIYPKITGSTDELNMTDTDSTNGTGPDNPNEDQIIAGIGSDIKTVNFWGLESYWGDTCERLFDLKIMESRNANSGQILQPTRYVVDYIETYGSIIVTKSTGIDVIYDSKDKFIEDYNGYSNKFIAVCDENEEITRVIDVLHLRFGYAYIEKMIFGTHADIIAKTIGGYASSNLCFTDYTYVGNLGYTGTHSYGTKNPEDGISCITIDNIQGAVAYGARIMYNGNENTVHVIDDDTEEL